MFEFALVLARVLVEVPRMVWSSEEEGAEGALRIGLEEVQRRYQALAEQERQQAEESWRAFCTIVEQQNEVQRAAMHLNMGLIRQIGVELVQRGDLEDEALQDEAEVLQDELWVLTSQMPLDALEELLDHARALCAS